MPPPNARQVLEDLIWNLKSGSPPVISASFEDAGDGLIPLPLGMLGLERSECLLGEAATVSQPLPYVHAVPRGTCIQEMTTAMPRSLGLGDGCECTKLDRLLEPLVEPSPPYYNRFADVRSYLKSPTTDTSPRGLLLLAHHADGFLDYHSSFQDALPAEQIQHGFPPGSAAILVSCTVGSVTPLNRSLPVLSKLNENGMDAVIFSPFTINAVLGSRLAVHFSYEIEQSRSKDTTLRELYDAVLARVRDDKDIRPYVGDLNLLTLAGNGEIPLCLPPLRAVPPSSYESQCRCNPLVYVKELLQRGGSWFLGGPSDPNSPTLPKSGVGPGDRAAVRRCMVAADEALPRCHKPRTSVVAEKSGGAAS